jgi:hypothetical protein
MLLLTLWDEAFVRRDFDLKLNLIRFSMTNTNGLTPSKQDDPCL